MPGLVIFDCDGVLVDSEPLANRVMREQLARVGLSVTAVECDELLVGRTLNDCVAIIESHTGGSLPGGFMDNLWDATRIAFDRELLAVSGITEVLESLSDSFCVASSGGRDKICHSLRLTSLAGYFPAERIFSAEEVERGKPAPDLFLMAAEKMGFETHDCVVVEDSVPGVEAARSAGMNVLGYAARTSAGKLTTAGAVVFSQMQQLPALLKTA
ncbi:MAG: HAD family hydrolase [Gammaproteobacteria bacterium]